MKKPKFIPEFNDIPTGRQKMPELPLEERALNFKEVELGLTEEMVLAEASRCLSCRRCIGCGLCLAECEPDAIVYDEKGRDVTLEADAVIFTSDGDAFDAGRKRELGYRESADIITSLEFERLVSPTGPFGGLLVRPFDGEVPQSMAFIQCVGSREEGIGANYCSVHCCSRTLSQARRARELVGQMKIHVFHRGMRPVGKDSEKDLEGLRAEDWVEFTEAHVMSAKEDRETGTVTVTFEKGDESCEKAFDLVVLAVGTHSRRDFKRYARAGGAKVNKFGFVERNLVTLMEHKGGVAFAGAINGPTSGPASIVDALAAASRTAGSCVRDRKAPAELRSGGGNPLVFACEYGLQLAGRDRSVVERLERDGSQVDGLHPFLCYKAGSEAIRRKLGDASGMVVIGCHSNSHEELFEHALGLPPRGVVILGKEDIDGNLQEKVASAVSSLLRPGTEPASVTGPATVVVVGGGISGLAAAGELVRRGLGVVVIEKSTEVGGPLRKAVAPQALPEGSDPGEGSAPNPADKFIKALTSNSKLRVLTSARLVSVEGKEGRHTVKISTSQGAETIEAGALLIATGAGPYEPEDYGYGQSDSVLTQKGFGARVAKGEKPWKKVVMIQCVGARDAEHPYCSRFCCRQALTNALRYKESDPEAEITILHRGIRTFGIEEELYTDAEESGIALVQIEGRPNVTTGGSLCVKAGRTDGGPLDLQCDAVVLSVAHHHGEEQTALASIAGVPLDELGFVATVNPMDSPFETAVPGVFVCGFARSPVIAEDAFVEGVGAAGEVCRYIRA